MHFMLDNLIWIYIALDTHGSEFDNDNKVPEIGVIENSILLLVSVHQQIWWVTREQKIDITVDKFISLI